MSSFIETSGSDSIQEMTNFTVLEIEKIYYDSKEYVNERFNIGKKKIWLHYSRYFVHDACSFLKWRDVEFSGAHFKLKSLYFQRMIYRFLEIFLD